MTFYGDLAVLFDLHCNILCHSISNDLVHFFKHLFSLSIMPKLESISMTFNICRVSVPNVGTGIMPALSSTVQYMTSLYIRLLQ